MTDPEPTRELPLQSDAGPPWQLALDRDYIRSGIRIRAGRRFPDGTVHVLTGDSLAVREYRGPAGTSGTIPEDALVLPDEFARALYDALGEHYGHTSTTRDARADLEHERTRRDATEDRLHELAAQAVAALTRAPA